MKKLLAVVMVAVMACALVACSSNNNEQEQQPPTTEQGTVEGVVIDATMNQVTIADEQGNEHSYSMENAPSLPDGLLLGMALSITYDGDTITALKEVPRTIVGTFKDQSETTLTITTEAGVDLTFNTEGAEFQIADGLKDGDTVAVTCTGGVEEATGDTSHCKVTTVARNN